MTRWTERLLALIEHVGSDQFIEPAELTTPAEGDCRYAAALAELWATYTADWERFTGSRLDPQFERLRCPAEWTGSIRVTDGAPIVIAGLGPSIRRALPALQRVRDCVHVVTSPRGADVLAEVGLTPDLVLVEHQTPLDAQFSVQERWQRNCHALTRAPWVVAEARTPAALLEGVAAARLLVPARHPSFGLWPATAVALALGSGAERVILLGVDLGSRHRPDPAHAPLRALLELMARHTGDACIDAGVDGAVKRGWTSMALHRAIHPKKAAPLEVARAPWTSVEERRVAARGLLARTECLADHAAAVLDAACRVRDGDESDAALWAMSDRLEGFLHAGARHEDRVDIQDGLGASFLPRYCRTPPDPSIGPRLWRPAALAAHELLGQHRALGERLGQEM